MSPHRSLTAHVCSEASMTRCAWNSLVTAMIDSPAVKSISTVRGSEEIEFMNGTAIHVTIIIGF